MNKKFFLFLLFVAVLISSQKISACPITQSNNVLEIHSEENYILSRYDFSSSHTAQKRFQDFSRRTGNFNAVFSKSDSNKILENIEFQRLRNTIFTAKNNSIPAVSKASEQTASTIHQSRLTSIHQDINQRK